MEIRLYLTCEYVFHARRPKSDDLLELSVISLKQLQQVGKLHPTGHVNRTPLEDTLIFLPLLQAP